MPTFIGYPYAIRQAGNFTNANNLIGNNTNTATHSGSVPNNTGLFASLKIDVSSIPRDAILTSVVFFVTAMASATNSRSFYTVALYDGNTPFLFTGNRLMGTSMSTYSIPMGVGHIASSFKGDVSLFEWEVTFLSLTGNNITTTWQKAWVEVTYTVPATGPSAAVTGLVAITA